MASTLLWGQRNLSRSWSMRESPCVLWERRLPCSEPCFSPAQPGLLVSVWIPISLPPLARGGVSERGAWLHSEGNRPSCCDLENPNYKASERNSKLLLWCVSSFLLLLDSQTRQCRVLSLLLWVRDWESQVSSRASECWLSPAAVGRPTLP